MEEGLKIAEGLENDGRDCQCAAYASFECGCDANWADYHTKDAALFIRKLLALASVAEDKAYFNYGKH